MTKKKTEKLRVARKEAERSRKKRNRKNSLRSRMGTRLKSQSTSFKSGPSVKFGQSHRVVDFRPGVVQLLINPIAEKKATVYRCFGCGKGGTSLWLSVLAVGNSRNAITTFFTISVGKT